MVWRFSALVLVLNRCRGQTAGVQQLHLLLTALRSPLAQQALLRVFGGGRVPDDVFVRNDPALTRTIKIAEATDLVEMLLNGTVRLTGKGRSLARFVVGQKDLFRNEKEFLDRLPSKMTQKQFQALLETS
jgi:hypothetical protein